MEKSILNNLFDTRCDEFEKEVKKREVDCENLLDNIMEILTNDEEKSFDECQDVFFKILEYVMAWNKRYYKLGFLDGVNLERELSNEKIYKINYDEKFFVNYDTDFSNFIDRYRREKLYKIKRYNELMSEINSIKEKHSNVRNFFENDEFIEFNDNEKEAIIKILRLENGLHYIEIVEAFKLGFRE